MSQLLHPLAAGHLHVTDPEVTSQTILESEITHAIDVGSFTVHHGWRYGSPIVLVVANDGSRSAVWYDESLPEGRA